MQSCHLKLPPGLQPYALKSLGARIVAPIATVVALSRVLRATGAAALPGVLVAALAALSVPAALAVSAAYRGWTRRRGAARLSAVLPPRWDGKRIGNIDLLNYSIERFHNGYLGAHRSIIVSEGTLRGASSGGR